MPKTAFFAGAACLVAVSATAAATFTVNTTSDLTDALPGDGTCETATGNGLCSLRAAILEANALAGPDTVLVPAGTYALGIAGDLENGGLTGDLDITDSVTIRGAGRSSTILDGMGLDRVLDVVPGGLPLTVEISRLTIQGGTPLRDEPIGGNVGGGGGVLVRGGAVRLADATLRDNRIDALVAAGGGVHNNGDLTLTRCVLTGNRAYYGGGVHNLGGLTLTGTAVTGNTAFGSVGSGGGIYNGAVATIANSTIGGNTASSGNCGGIQNLSLLGLANVTLAGNEAFRFGGALCNQGTMEIRNTILADNRASGAADNCRLFSGTVESVGYNLEDLDTCGLAGVGDRVTTNPVLGPLQDNGGSTLVRPLLDGSPAIDAGNPDGCVDITAVPSNLATDQRGVPRPLDGDQDLVVRCDVGAHEFDRHDVWGVAAASDPFTLTWQALPGASGYLVYRGNMAALRSGNYGDCFTTGGDLTVTKLEDAEIPPAGDFFFYLVAARVDGEEWTIGFASSGQERSLEPSARCP